VEAGWRSVDIQIRESLSGEWGDNVIRPRALRAQPGEGGTFVIVDQDSRIVYEGEEIRDLQEAMRQIEVIAQREGMTLMRNPTKEGQVEYIEVPHPRPPETRFTIDSLREVNDIKFEVDSELRSAAAAHALKQGRKIVTSDGIREVSAEVFERMAKSEAVLMADH
jgi:hypothetical protein